MRSPEGTYSASLGENALGHLNALLKAFGGKMKVINVCKLRQHRQRQRRVHLELR